MVVLLMLFPVSFLFGHFVSTPLLIKGLGLPFPIALLVSNISGILLLNQFVPWASKRSAWSASERAGAFEPLRERLTRGHDDDPLSRADVPERR